MSQYGQTETENHESQSRKASCFQQSAEVEAENRTYLVLCAKKIDFSTSLQHGHGVIAILFLRRAIFAVILTPRG